ncbi:hypothetical protein FSP39_019203 [Pinctada imbricata]|uniref:EF-hand domain-containing protein n=1 Tax=Pinctada imbricata TaxID=66713 RepID=A0AA89BZP9_PINIB|nr:hypothetical protein FSP39_019203 [Pinctada imbricata]
MAESEPSREIIAYIRERDEAKAEQKKSQDELLATKSKLYDAKSRIQELEEQLKEAKETSKKPVANGKVSTGNAKTNSKKAPPKSPTPQPKGGNPKASLAPPSSPQPPSATSGGVRHPPITGKEHLSNNTELYYEEIARTLPDLKLITVLEAEKKFNLADINKDGVIDKDELDKVLADNVTIFTPAQVEQIIKEIDQDNNGTLEFIEVLMVLEKMGKRRSKLANIPANVQDSQTKVCSIQ